MSTVIDILEQLEATSGSNAKRDILEFNRHNDLLKRVFVAAQDPYIVYYVNRFKMPPVNSSAPSHEISDDEFLDDFLDFIMNDLATRRITGTTAKNEVVRRFACFNTPELQKWCLRILLKNLRCGVQETSVNKVWPGTLKSFAVALACTLKSEFVKGEGIRILEPVSYPVRVEPKLDGLRCIAVKKNGVTTFCTRNGTVLETMPRIKAVLDAAPYDNVVLDGEMLANGNWNESASVLMSSKAKKDDSSLVYNVFDCVGGPEWEAQEDDTPYRLRAANVSLIIENLPKGAPVVQVPHIMAKDEQELKAYFNECLDGGFEGIMLKRLDTPYLFKRSENILKLKPCVTWEGVIVGHYEGHRGSKREGLWGGFEMMLTNGVVTRVGGGFNDALRAQIQLDTPDAWIGKIIEVEGQPDMLTKDGLNKDGKVRFPVFIRVRPEADADPTLVELARKVMS